MGYFYDGGIAPGTQGTSTGTVGYTNVDMEKDTTTRLWELVNENTELKHENYMLKGKLDQINKIISEWK
jgi:regulator of replication initiation timing